MLGLRVFSDNHGSFSRTARFKRRGTTIKHNKCSFIIQVEVFITPQYIVICFVLKLKSNDFLILCTCRPVNILRVKINKFNSYIHIIRQNKMVKFNDIILLCFRNLDIISHSF